mmetsp:Transcript_39545/g.61675  ORF Transcript_39545/g.61675 Transcript_39545/m.61675 type:complete len:125 (+) Transcript_39545:176-550(+)
MKKTPAKAYCVSVWVSKVGRSWAKWWAPREESTPFSERLSTLLAGWNQIQSPGESIAPRCTLNPRDFWAPQLPTPVAFGFLMQPRNLEAVPDPLSRQILSEALPSPWIPQKAPEVSTGRKALNP